MKKIRLTEKELTNIIKRVINEQTESNDEVLNIQKALNKVWTNVKIKEDGILGPETEKYIKLYQSQNSLTETGKIDDKLKKKLLPLINQPKGKDDKAELIRVLRNHLNSMEENNKFDAMGVAQVMYNDCAHFMNKTDIFSGRQGNVLSTKAPFAPRN
jgi:peptidoglycan hydrolase-like protein with peptidoglycan-binding domain